MSTLSALANSLQVVSVVKRVVLYLKALLDRILATRARCPGQVAYQVIPRTVPVVVVPTHSF